MGAFGQSSKRCASPTPSQRLQVANSELVLTKYMLTEAQFCIGSVNVRLKLFSQYLKKKLYLLLKYILNVQKVHILGI